MLPFVGAVLLGLAIAELCFYLTTVFLHRSLCHRALQLSPAARAVSRVIIWMGTGTRPRQWVAVHRKHHARSDTDQDPHSPLVLGTAKVLFANAVLYRRVVRDGVTVERYARDLPPDRWDRILFDHGLLGPALGTALLITLFGWQLGAVAAGVHMVTYILGGGAINAIGHRWGRRPFDNLATNNQWLAWLVAGEGLHNNHHAAATSSRFSMARGEIDPGWWCVRALVRLRLANVRHDEPRLLKSRAAFGAGD